MALVGEIKDGAYVKDKTAKDEPKANQYDKEMFLQLLVAEMQYQDPLEPTSNTEYVSELASFSQIEAVQAVQEQMSTLEANSLVGKYVILLDNDEYVSGKVDYIANDDDKGMVLSVNDKLYEINKLDSVVDETYYNAVLMAKDFTDTVQSLPSGYGLTLQDENKITAARKVLDSMDDYTKGFVASETVDKLKEAENRIAYLKSQQADDAE
ncbi:MAG: flagellar hook capping protein [Pseudobutyrivibrio sp.]|nr:flagellar hook capping protein [Pseudobutyrivibrio sp.]